MGCTSSKVDDLPAVALCRERCTFLDQAIQQRFALAEAHVAYIRSLKGVGSSLHNFIEQESGHSVAPLSPKLNLPPQRKGDPVAIQSEGTSSPKKKGLAHHSHSHSNSGSHLHFHDDTDDEDSGSGGSLHHSGHSSPFGHIEYANSDYMNTDQEAYQQQTVGSFPGGFKYANSDYMNTDQEAYQQQTLGSFPGGFMHMNYMTNKVTPSIVHEQRPMSSEILHMGESSSSAYYPYPYPGNNPSSYSYFGPPNYGGGGAMMGYNGSAPQYGSSSPQAAVASSSKPPPSPPKPTASPWDFLNVFESYDKFYPQYTPSRDLKKLREEEGIPDLEDEDYQHEVVKEVYGDQKVVDVGGNYSKSVDDEDKVGKTEASLYQTRPSVSMENEGVEYDVHVVENKVVDDKESQERSNAAGFKGRGGSRDVSEVAIEIKIQFERASESGSEIAKMLEVGKLPYQRKHVSAKMLQGVTPSLSVVASQPSTSKGAGPSSFGDKADPASLEIDEVVAMTSRSLSSTLQKLYLWEKKLYNEVKGEEKMRVVHERKCRKLKRLDERGAEAHKLDSTQTLIRSLSTKIRIAIQVVDKISVTINKIRDEELWPQLNELIQGLNRMWKGMLECHRNQCQVIREARNLGPVGSGKKLSDDHLRATMQLEHELLNWTFRFSSWVGAQKGYVRALNNWLLKCLLYEPEETPDGVVPFSPGRMGAPPVFVICNQWSQALERISEKEVVDSMRVFATSVLQRWEHDKEEMRQRMMLNKDLERKVRNLDKEDQKIQKEMQALDKKIVLISGDGNSLPIAGHVVYQSDTSSGSLKGSLQRIFDAMERFTADSMKAYEELLQRSEEERLAREHERVS